MENDRNPTESILKKEFLRKLEGYPTNREIRIAMQNATSIGALHTLVEMSERLNAPL